MKGDSFCSPGPATEYYVHDQLVFTADGCSSLLGRETSNALVEIESAVRDGFRFALPIGSGFDGSVTSRSGAGIIVQGCSRTPVGCVVR
jgi:hypothetical protein